MRRRAIACGLALAIIICAGLLDPAPAQGRPPLQAGADAIAYGQSVLSRISRSNRAVFYFVRAQRGDVISITMQRLSGNLDPHLDLATAEGGILISNDDDPLAEGTLNAAIRDFTILKNGVYLIQASGYGETEGSFTLAVTRTPSEELGRSPERALLIDYGAALSSTLDAESPLRYFRFYAEAGDLLTVTVQSPDIAPVIAILDSAANELARAADTGAAGQARIVAFDAPVSGVYWLAASATAPLSAASGSARLALQLSGRAAPQAGQASEISYGDAVTGLITPAATVEEYVFQGRAGDVVRVRMEHASGDLDPLITLYDRERKQIAFDDDGAGEKDALIDAFSLPYSGPYILSASRYQRGLGQTSGAYILQLELIRPGE